MEQSEQWKDYLRLIPHHGGLHRRNHGREPVSHVLWAVGFLESMSHGHLLTVRLVTGETTVIKEHPKEVGLGPLRRMCCVEEQPSKFEI